MKARRMQGGWSVFALLVVGAVAATAALPEDPKLEATRFFTPTASADCHWHCDGSELEGFGEPPEQHECWGTFRFWCKAPPSQGSSSNSTGRFWGSICKGHFQTWKLEGPAATFTNGQAANAGGKRLVVCEGGHKWISGRISTCPHTGETYKSMMGSLALGTVADIMTSAGQPNHSTNAGTAAGSSSSSTAAGPTATALAASRAAAAAEAGQELESDPLVKQLRQQVAATGAHSQVTDSQGPSFKLEGRREGFSVQWRAVKKVCARSSGSSSSGSWDELLGLEQAEQDAEDLLHPSWLDWWSSLLPGRKPHGGPGAGDSRRDRHGSFQVLCNGRPAWFHGAAPCWGNLTVVGESSTDTDTSPGPSSTSTGRALRAFSAQQPAQLVQQHQAAAAAAAALHNKQTSTAASTVASVTGHVRRSSMRAECDGLWTGLLGHACKGLNTAHSEVEAEEWRAEKWSICSGRSSVHFMRRKDVRGMASDCRGKAVQAVSVAGGNEQQA